ncbi:MAG TPA: GNAT family N-acetyltransferase [Acidimicrobiales bacterium]|jgi:GNAT superfamily N-acetyltransferase|nr:GNAT family N-acetyltransferase [Acidimicrobiales bacterium]
MPPALEALAPPGEAIFLSDGTEVELRPIAPTDAGALVAFHSGLSDRSRFLRYFYPHVTLSAGEVAHLTQVDGRERVAFVVEHDGALIAVGRYEKLGDPTQAEVAFVVSDAFQHHGIASLLLQRLADRARAAGMTHLTAEVLAENRMMLRVFHDSGFEVESDSEWGTVQLRMAIASSPQPSD